VSTVVQDGWDADRRRVCERIGASLGKSARVGQEGAQEQEQEEKEGWEQVY
jgi:hypothetical protein